MSLIKCPGCGNHISELESHCPSCEFPLTEELVREIRKNQQHELKEKEKPARRYAGMTFFL